MKAAHLKNVFAALVNNFVIEALERDEVELGFDAMLNYDVVSFLITNHNIANPLAQQIISKQNAVSVLDEYELAMI